MSDKTGSSGDDKAPPFKLPELESAALSSPSPSSDSQLNLAVGSPTSQFTVFRRSTPRSRSKSIPASQSDMLSCDLFQSPSDSSQPKRLHVSNIPFRYR